MDIINFSTNWNNKLDCLCFTTIRLSNPKKYKLNCKYVVNLKKEPYKKVEIIAIQPIWFKQINEFIARLDTGYGEEDTKKILKKMYAKVDLETTPFYFILFKTLDNG